MKVLKDARLVTDSASGTRRLYRPDYEALRNLRDYFDRFWDTALTEFKKKAEGTDS